MIDSRFRLANAGQTRLTMELTMTLDHWMKLQEALNKSEISSSEPLWSLRHRILALIDFANKHFIVSADDEKVAENG